MTMTDLEILKGIKKYFAVHEFVGRSVYNKYGESAWKFIDFRLMWAVLIIRVNLGKKITGNNYRFGGKLSQRGLRTNVQQLFRQYFKKFRLYLSAHILGKGFDFDVEGMTAPEVRKWIIKNEDLFPFKIRLEDGVKWVHLDVIQEQKNPKIYLFTI